MDDRNDVWERSNGDQNDRAEVEIEAPPNWPGAIVMIAFFVTLIVICGICTWGVVELGGIKI